MWMTETEINLLRFIAKRGVCQVTRGLNVSRLSPDVGGIFDFILPQARQIRFSCRIQNGLVSQFFKPGILTLRSTSTRRAFVQITELGLRWAFTSAPCDKSELVEWVERYANRGEQVWMLKPSKQKTQALLGSEV